MFAPWQLDGDADGEPLASFGIESGANNGWLVSENGAARGTGESLQQALRWVELQAVTTLLDEPGPLTVHAALVAEPQSNRGVLLLGPGHSGKSTLALACWHSGWTLLSDDVTLLLDPGDQKAQALPRRVSLRFGSHEFFPSRVRERLSRAASFHETEEGWLFHPPTNGSSPGRSCQLAAAVFLARGREAPTLAPAPQVRPIDPAAALMAMALCTNYARQDRFDEVIPRLRPWAESVPAYDLDRGPLDRMVSAVASTLE